MTKKFNLTIVGATGIVGRKILSLLEDFPINTVKCVSSSNGKELSFGDKVLKTHSLQEFDFSGTDIAIFAISTELAKRYIPKATSQGAIVIDNSSAYRQHDDVPLIVPEINPERIEEYKNKSIIASPNCIATPLAMVAKALEGVCQITRIVASTYQSVSGAGKKAMDELFNQTKARYMNVGASPEEFEHPIPFNIIPQIGDIQSNGYTEEENKIANEVAKLLDEPALQICATSVRVPVFVGHSISANIEFERQVSSSEAFEALQKSKGIIALNNKCITPQDIAGDEEVFVTRIRNDVSCKNALNMWITSDNLLKGAALNTVEIARLLIKHM